MRASACVAPCYRSVCQWGETSTEFLVMVLVGPSRPAPVGKAFAPIGHPAGSTSRSFRAPWSGAQMKGEGDLLRTHWSFPKTILMMLVLGVGCPSFGCGNDGKSDGQIPASPEANKASQAIGEQYSKQYSEKFAKKGA